MGLLSPDQKPLGLAAPFGPSSAPRPDMLLHFRDATIGASGWEPLGFNAHNLWIEVPGDGLHVVAIYRSEELLRRVDFGVHAFAVT